MESAPGEPSTRSLLGPLALLGLLMVVGAAVVLGSSRQPPERLSPPVPADIASPPRAPAAVVAVASAPLDYAADGLPIKPHDPRDPEPEGPMHPHPITPAHERIYHENNLVGQLNGAMDVKDVEGLRRLLKQYREEYPEDPNALQEGYEVIADCLESPGEASRARAQRYYDEKTASSLRRYVRRHCFEGG